ARIDDPATAGMSVCVLVITNGSTVNGANATTPISVIGTKWANSSLNVTFRIEPTVGHSFEKIAASIGCGLLREDDAWRRDYSNTHATASAPMDSLNDRTAKYMTAPATMLRPPLTAAWARLRMMETTGPTTALTRPTARLRPRFSRLSTNRTANAMRRNPCVSFALLRRASTTPTSSTVTTGTANRKA